MRYQAFFLISLIVSCQGNNQVPSEATISALNLKQGGLIACGPPDKKFGTTSVMASVPKEIRKDFNLALSLLHSFEYDEAEKVFAAIIKKKPDCAMAYWGVAMCNYHPLWAPPSIQELEKGARAIAVAQSISPVSKLESAYINAIASFYKNYNSTTHADRTKAFEKHMEQMRLQYPSDREALIFYTLSLNASANPSDKSYKNQRKAGKLLDSLYSLDSSHPGILHYIIHTYDYPELAKQALPAAKKYAEVASASAHAQHMPSHIFTRLGLWEDDIRSNLASTASAKCYAENIGLNAHWDEELHGLDYLVYAYLQQGDNLNAKKYTDYLRTITKVEPANFKVAYAFAAIPARYVLENKLWKDAASLTLHPADFPWKNFSWQKAIFHFTKLLGFTHLHDIASAELQLQELKKLHEDLVLQKDEYKANQVAIQLYTGEAWILLAKNKNDSALQLMKKAADMEDQTGKHPVTPCEVLPARELLGDMLLQLKRPAEAVKAYEINLQNNPGRRNGINGYYKAKKLLQEE